MHGENYFYKPYKTSNTVETSPNCNKNKDCYCISNFPAIEVILRTTQYSGSQRGGPWSPGALKFLLWSPGALNPFGTLSTFTHYE